MGKLQKYLLESCLAEAVFFNANLPFNCEYELRICLQIENVFQLTI